MAQLTPHIAQHWPNLASKMAQKNPQLNPLPVGSCLFLLTRDQSGYVGPLLGMFGGTNGCASSFGVILWLCWAFVGHFGAGQMVAPAHPGWFWLILVAVFGFLQGTWVWRFSKPCIGKTSVKETVFTRFFQFVVQIMVKQLWTMISYLLLFFFLHAWASSWLCFSICPCCRKFSFQTSLDHYLLCLCCWASA